MAAVGTLPPAVAADVREILRLVEEEASLRCAGRIQQLIPGNAAREVAVELFREANQLRSQRLFLLQRCGLLD